MKEKVEIRNNDDWECLLSFLPSGWEQMAYTSGAAIRLRGFSNAANLLRTLLIHFFEGCSLRQTVVHAKQLGIADISDVALLKRLNVSGEWFRQMSQQLIKNIIPSQNVIPQLKDYEIELVDATCICKPGSVGTDWRVHYGIELPTLHCKTIHVTDKHVGETFKHFDVTPNKLFIGDRGYSNQPGIAYVVNKSGNVLVRMNSANLPLKTEKNRDFMLLNNLKKLSINKIGEWNVHFVYNDIFVKGRVCAIKKSRVAAEKAKEKIIREAKKKQKVPKPETLEAAEYIFVFTTLPNSIISAKDVLEIYRGRWQIELSFKRLKSLLELGSLPKKDPPGAKSWIYGKLFCAILIETLITDAECFSPWGYNIESGV